MRRILAALGIVVVVTVVVGIIIVTHGGAVYHTEALLVPVVDGPNNDQHVAIDATVFVPTGATARRPAPAVILSHGFGGSKDDERSDAIALAGHGYVVLTYSARGFGGSGGQIALDSPDYEVKDVHQLVDFLSTRTEVRQDGPGDPRVGLAGTSYGAGITLLASGSDHRVDADIPILGWNNLANALDPNFATVAGATAAGAPAGPGVFKKGWAADLFSSTQTQSTGGTRGTSPSNSTCGRFVLNVCQVYEASATTGNATPQAIALLGASSPAGVLGNVHAPTMLIQGEADSLFPLSQADANARSLEQGDTPLEVVWIQGGHDQPLSDAEAAHVRDLSVRWFARYLRNQPVKPGNQFQFATQTSSRSSGAAHYELGQDRTTVALNSPLSRSAINPAGGSPTAVSSLPGLGSLGSLLSAASDEPAGQRAVFETSPLRKTLRVVGAPHVQVQITSSAGAAVMFAKLYDVDPSGTATLPQQLASPIRISTENQGRPVDIELPTIAHNFATGDRLQLVFSSTDEGYSTPPAPAVYVVTLATPALATLDVPLAPAGSAPPASSGGPIALLVAAIVLVLVAVLAAGARIRRNRGDQQLDDPASPVRIDNLTKQYASGVRAVDEVSFSIEPGQIVGLLGPNGAGKTTTLRMLLGLVHPSAGTVSVFGRRVRAGSPVLARVGALVEGPGLLPHLSGMDNLATFWRASGRPQDAAHIDEALAVADLGDSIHRRVRTYSHGMKQRLAIAQAMLGRPDLLVLDEPTNGLDPSQIRDLRQVLHDYAGRGTNEDREAPRSVLLSSHLLSEVEVVCTHVVVMDSGKVIRSGAVGDVIGGRTHLEDAFFALVEGGTEK